MVTLERKLTFGMGIEEETPQEEELVQALASELDLLLASRTSPVSVDEEPVDICSEASQRIEVLLLDLLKHLDQNTLLDGYDAAVDLLIEKEVPARLLASLPLLAFETRKIATRLLAACFRKAAMANAVMFRKPARSDSSGSGSETSAGVGSCSLRSFSVDRANSWNCATPEHNSEGLCGTPVVGDEASACEGLEDSSLCSALLDGMDNLDIFIHCSQLLQNCVDTSPVLVRQLLSIGAVERLMKAAQHPKFEVASEAVASLRHLLLGHKALSAAWIAENFQTFFDQLHVFLQLGNYPILRQALGMLTEMLLAPEFLVVMSRYSTSESYFQIHMNLLRNSSPAVQLEAFHIFKLFVVSPHRNPRVERMIFKNKDRLTRLLDALGTLKQVDEQLAEDMRHVLHFLISMTG